MVELRSVAVTIGEIRQPGAAGYPNNILMVPYKLAQDRLDEFDSSHQLVLKENDMLSKKVERLIIQNEKLTKMLAQQHTPQVNGVCRQ